MPVWSPSDPWPSATPGGVAAPAWGGYVKLWVRAAIAAGRPFHLGPHTNDRLSAGNVLGGGELLPRAAGEQLWVDLSCDVLEVAAQGGAGAGQGVFGKVDAATVTVRLADPDGIYDPLHHGGPFAYAGRSRLIPGTPVEVFAQVVNGADGTWHQYPIFTGTADLWAEDWVPHPWNREATLIATDGTKTWARYDKPEQAPVGGGETVTQRVHRLVDYFAWGGVVDDPAGGSTRTLAATTLAQPGWELLNRALDDELGVCYFTPAGHLRWINREAAQAAAPARIHLGCQTVDPAAHDVLADANPQKFDLQLRNDVYAANTGGTQQHATSAASVERYGPYQYQRTDLGLASDAQAAQWATQLVALYAFPQVGIDDVELLPALDPASWTVWATVLDFALYTDVATITWAPPDLPDHTITGDVRVVGWKHAITRHRWAVTWNTVAVRPLNQAGVVFTMGPHPNDRLDAGYVLT